MGGGGAAGGTEVAAPDAVAAAADETGTGGGTAMLIGVTGPRPKSARLPESYGFNWVLQPSNFFRPSIIY